MNSNWSYSPEMLNSGKNWLFFFVPRDLEIWWMTLKNNRVPLLCYIALCSISKPLAYSNLSYSPETPNSGQNWRFFVLGDFENWRVTLKNNEAPLLYYVKLCASFQIHWWSQTWVTPWKRSSRVGKNDLEIWRTTLKTVGHLSPMLLQPLCIIS